MTAKLNLRREKPYLVPCPTGYLSGRSSVFSQKSGTSSRRPGISSVFA
ncbi:hypothetical protein [Pseudomonas umsongensis]|nr:hypothetical protein [Pseudomonas umsongensis]